jgi:N-acetyl-beta-hexosaminidase
MKGIEIFTRMFDFEISDHGLCVSIEKSSSGKLEVEKDSNGAVIRYDKKIHFFRGLGLLLQNIRENKMNFSIKEEPQFSMNGAMFDVSQGNAVINVENVKRLLARMAAMGLNMLMLYAEDSFEIKGEPYFGYMRSKYTFDEMKELDDYADIFGIEMIPCVQTLAHLIDALKWRCYREIREDDDTLLVGCEKTYEFIEKIICSASAPFRTKRIHIGMDEAWKLGQGDYLLINGYRNKFDIMTDHLSRVIEITDKYGLKPMIWSDMYFRAGSKNGDYYDIDCNIPPEIMNKTPKDVQLVYWDYYHDNEAFYTDWIKRHKKFGSDPIFAGGLWSWTGFSLNYSVTFKNTNTALNACKDEGIREVFATIWGDDTTESNIYSNLLGLQLFAEHGYSKDLDENKLAQRFSFCTGGVYESFMDLSKIDEIPGCMSGNPHNCNSSKFLMWQDVLLGLFDKNINELELSEHYRQLEKQMENHAAANGEFGFVFEYMKKVCAVLSIKAELGVRTTLAYRSGDTEMLGAIAAKELPELVKRVKELREYHRSLWMKINKPMGWEVLDCRYGFLLMRLDTAIYRIEEYLDGKTDAISELEQERLYFQGEKELAECNVYNRMPTSSRISYTTFYMF